MSARTGLRTHPSMRPTASTRSINYAGGAGVIIWAQTILVALLRNVGVGLGEFKMLGCTQVARKTATHDASLSLQGATSAAKDILYEV